MVNQLVGQSRNRQGYFRVRWVRKNWRHSPEKSTNLENFFTMRLFDDGSKTVLQEVHLHRKFMADNVAGFWRSDAVFR
jgi:hypothetical protein